MRILRRPGDFSEGTDQCVYLATMLPNSHLSAPSQLTIDEPDISRMALLLTPTYPTLLTYLRRSYNPHMGTCERVA